MARLGIKNARNAVEQCLTGEIGAFRRMPIGVFARGTFDGQPRATQQALSMQTSEARNRFDVTFVNWRDSESTPSSSKSNRWVAKADMKIDVVTRAATVAQRDDRDDLLDQILEDLRNAKQALEWPENLRTTADGSTTTIASGMIDELRFSTVREDWTNQLIYSAITGIIRLDVVNDT